MPQIDEEKESNNSDEFERLAGNLEENAYKWARVMLGIKEVCNLLKNEILFY